MNCSIIAKAIAQKSNKMLLTVLAGADSGRRLWEGSACCIEVPAASELSSRIGSCPCARAWLTGRVNIGSLLSCPKREEGEASKSRPRSASRTFCPASKEGSATSTAAQKKLCEIPASDCRAIFRNHSFKRDFSIMWSADEWYISPSVGNGTLLDAELAWLKVHRSYYCQSIDVCKVKAKARTFELQEAMSWRHFRGLWKNCSFKNCEVDFLNALMSSRVQTHAWACSFENCCFLPLTSVVQPWLKQLIEGICKEVRMWTLSRYTGRRAHPMM